MRSRWRRSSSGGMGFGSGLETRCVRGPRMKRRCAKRGCSMPGMFDAGNVAGVVAGLPGVSMRTTTRRAYRTADRAFIRRAAIADCGPCYAFARECASIAARARTRGRGRSSRVAEALRNGSSRGSNPVVRSDNGLIFSKTALSRCVPRLSTAPEVHHSLRSRTEWSSASSAPLKRRLRRGTQRDRSLDPALQSRAPAPRLAT